MMRNWRSALVIIFAITMAALVIAHVRRVNGPWYWTWSWRRLNGLWLYPAMLAAAAPFVVAQILFNRGRRRAALVCLAAAALALQLTALSFQPPGLIDRMTIIVQHPTITSYFLDAGLLHGQSNITTRELLWQYPDVVLLLHHHARYKPPGLLLFYLALISIFGKSTLAATIGGMIVALVASLAPIATYRMIKTLGQDGDAAFCAASYIALAPSLLLFLPMFDQTYVTLAAALITLYGLTVTRGRWSWAIAFGAAMALALFLSYIFLIFGLFFVVYLLAWAIDHGPRPASRAMMRLLTATAVCAALYGLLWVTTGFDPIRTFIVIAKAQTDALTELMRPFPQHIFDDLLDFALGAGWIAFLLAGLLLLRWQGDAVTGRQPRHRLVQVALLQIGVVAAAALLPGESARLWMLLLPLLMAPVGFELTNWSPRQRAIVYACLWLVMVAICQNMTFIYIGPEFDGARW